MISRRGIILASSSFLLPSPALAAGHGGVPGSIINDNVFYSPGGAGPWGSYGNVFNSGGLRYIEKTFVSTVAAGFPVHTVFMFNWPTGFTGGVHGQMAITYGDYLDTHPDTPITARALNTITTLVCTHDIGHSGLEYNIIYDIFLTSVPNNSGTVVQEIEILIHMPAGTAAYVTSRTPVGTTTISGIAWTITKEAGAGGVVYIFPTDLADRNAITIDVNAMFAYLISQAILTGNEFYNGHDLGPEPINGTGNVVFFNLAVIYA